MKDSTRTLKLLMNTKTGYRIERFCPSKRLEDIIRFEFETFGNMNILLHANKHYGLNLWNAAKKAHEIKGGNFEAYCRELAVESVKNHEELSLYEIISKLLYIEAETFSKEVMECIRNTTGKKCLTGIWLTTKTASEKFIKAEFDSNPEYRIPEDAIIVSDLDESGILFALSVKL